MGRPIFDHKLRLRGPSTAAAVDPTPTNPSSERWFAYEEQNPQAITKGVSIMGASTATAAGGTAVFNDGTGSYINYTSGTGISAVGGLAAAAANLVQLRHLPDILFVMKTGAVAADISNVRIWVGMHTDGALATDVPGSLGISGVVFRYSTPAGDTNWQAHTFDGVGDTAVDTGVVVTADTRYVFRIRATSTTTIEFYINGTLVAMAAGTIPAGTTNLQFGYCHTVNALAGTARAIRWRKTFIHSL